MKESTGLEFSILPETIREIQRIMQLGGIFRDHDPKNSS